MNPTRLGIATIQKKPNGCAKPLPLAKFIPKYPEMNVRGAKNTVTTANIIMKLFVLAPTVLNMRLETLPALASICSRLWIMVIQ